VYAPFYSIPVGPEAKYLKARTYQPPEIIFAYAPGAAKRRLHVTLRALCVALQYD